MTRKVPRELADRLLVANRHTCCICHEERKHVQIHHIDGNSANSVWENLAVVCLDCHSRVTGDEGLGRSFSSGEVEKYKRPWEEGCEHPHLVRRTKQSEDARTDLIVGDVKARGDESTFIAINDGGRIRTSSVTLIIDVPRDEPRHYDATITFDVTNRSSTDLRVVAIYIKTLAWKPLEQIVRYIPCAGLGEEKEFFCLIDSGIRSYEARFVGKSNQYVHLKPSELDTVSLKTTALTEGTYTVEVEVEYSTDGRTARQTIGPFEEMRFLERGRVFTLPR